jgi:hypothetical protein
MMEDKASELNEVRQDADCLVNKLRIAALMLSEQPIIAKTNIDQAIELCSKLKRWLERINHGK